MSTVEYLAEIWPRILTILSLCLDITVSGHAILYKRDSRAAVAWVGFIWFVPVVGALLYLLLGINRIQRRARFLRRRRRQAAGTATEVDLGEQVPLENLAEAASAPIPALAKLVGDVTNNPLLEGNRVTALTAETAWPAMLDAVENARRSLSLTTYIFDNDSAGRQLADALREPWAAGWRCASSSTQSVPDTVGRPSSGDCGMPPSRWPAFCRDSCCAVFVMPTCGTTARS